MVEVWLKSPTNKTLLVGMYEVAIHSPGSTCTGPEKVEVPARGSSHAKEVGMYYGWKVIGNPKKVSGQC